MNFALQMPALTGEPVTERHAQYCRDNGHAVHVQDGVKLDMCPRCGEVEKDPFETDTQSGRGDVW